MTDKNDIIIIIIIIIRISLLLCFSTFNYYSERSLLKIHSPKTGNHDIHFLTNSEYSFVDTISCL